VSEGRPLVPLRKKTTVCVCVCVCVCVLTSCILTLFNDVFSTAQVTERGTDERLRKMNTEGCGRTRSLCIVIIPWGTEENHDKHQARWMAFRRKLDNEATLGLLPCRG
jgi:hypothetical protein